MAKGPKGWVGPRILESVATFPALGLLQQGMSSASLRQFQGFQGKARGRARIRSPVGP